MYHKINVMKKTIIAFLFILCVSFKGFSQTVYITEQGKKYHAKNCSLVPTGKKGIQLAEAKKLGYEPCKHCKADEIREEKAAPKKPLTKSVPQAH
jgi:hypothetical protein